MVQLDYLVTGTGRCGTVYMARLLTELGIMCGHEAIFNTGGIEQALPIINGLKVAQSSMCSQVDYLTALPLGIWYDERLTRAESSYMAAPFLDHSCFDNTKIIHIVRNPLAVISSFHLDIDFFTDKPHDIYSEFVYKILPELTNIVTPVERACYYYVHWNEMIEKSLGEKSYLFLKIEDQPSSRLFEFVNKPPVAANLSKNINTWKKRNHDLKIGEIPSGDIKNQFLEMCNRYDYYQRDIKIFFQ